MNDDHAAPGLTISCQEVVELVTDYLQGVLDSDTQYLCATSVVEIASKQYCLDFDCLRRPGSGSWRAQQLCRQPWLGNLGLALLRGRHQIPAPADAKLAQ